MLLCKFFLLKYFSKKYIIMKSLKIALLLFTITLFACGGGSPSGRNTIPVPASNTDNGNGGGGTPAAPAPTTALTIASAAGNEGSMLNFTVTSTPNIAIPISFNYRIDFANQTANANDLNLSSDLIGTSTIATNDNSTTISIPIVDDNINEPAETFRITLINPSLSGATITQSTAIGTIATNDSDGIKTNLSVENGHGNEGENITFKVTSYQVIADPISFSYRIVFNNPQTLNSALADDLSGQLTGRGAIATNDSSTTISIGTADDNLREQAETFLVVFSNLSPSEVSFGVDNIAIGTILANDAATGIVRVSVANAKAREDTGTIKFKVTSNFSHSQDVTFDYEVGLDNPTSDNSASLDDFKAREGTATIDINDSSTTISISIATDDTIEPDETFNLQLTNLNANATVDSAKNLAVGKILNDDLGEISDATAIIGDEKITLNWTNPDSNLLAGVTISQIIGASVSDNCSNGRPLGIATNHTITGLTNGTPYSLRICARSTAGSLSSGVVLANLTPLPIVDKDENGLIEIATATELNNIRHNLAGTSYKTSGAGSGNTAGCPSGVCKGYELTENIDLSNFTNWDSIGSSSDRFTAFLEGNGKTISNLTIDRVSSSDVGLFSTMRDATISNLKLAEVEIIGNGNVGALVGRATGTTLSNIELIGDNLQSSSDAEIKGNGASVGGLVGKFQSGAITDSSSSLTVRGGASDSALHTGGLVGLFQSGSIKNSNSSGSVSASNSADIVGGLVGRNYGAISNSWASGNVSSTGNYNRNYGGLVGVNDEGISNSWASGNVSNNSVTSRYYGGLVGVNLARISNSWASGNVSSNGNSYGGLVGYNRGDISNSWASGEVTGNVNIGGLIGNLNAGNINGRNYQLDDASGGVNLANDDGMGVSFVLGRNSDRATKLTALANLSGAASGVLVIANYNSQQLARRF